LPEGYFFRLTSKIRPCLAQAVSGSWLRKQSSFSTQFMLELRYTECHSSMPISQHVGLPLPIIFSPVIHMNLFFLACGYYINEPTSVCTACTKAVKTEA